MNDREKSDPAVVAGKLPNKAGQPAAEAVEPRAGAEGNAIELGTHRTSGRASVSPGLDRVRQTSPSLTRGGSRMRESRTYGSVRGVRSNAHSYRDRFARNDVAKGSCAFPNRDTNRN